MANLYLLITFCIFQIFITISASRHLCPLHQSLSLLNLKDTLQIYTPPVYVGNDLTFKSKISSWNSCTDCCSWEGVTCDESTGHVIELDLSSSRLTGVIDSNSSIFQLSHLRTLNLGDNDLQGEISPEFRSFTHLSHLNLSSSSFEGEVPIPKSIGGLIAIQQLNLSHNNFTGHIPPQLGNLSNVHSLDLSCNQLDGNIPDKFAALGSLSVMNLSYNHLSGRIPSGPQLQVIPNDSYIGNDGLCGFPLSTSCGKHEPSPHATRWSSRRRR